MCEYVFTCIFIYSLFIYVFLFTANAPQPYPKALFRALLRYERERMLYSIKHTYISLYVCVCATINRSHAHRTYRQKKHPDTGTHTRTTRPPNEHLPQALNNAQRWHDDECVFTCTCTYVFIYCCTVHRHRAAALPEGALSRAAQVICI